MALVVKDRVRETSTTTGTGTITLAGAVTGYQSFSAIGNANTTYYTIYLQGGNEWEVGIGTYTASGTTLSRDTILASSNGGSAVNFSAGVKDVFVTYPAGRSVYYDTATNVTLNALTLSGGTANGVLYLNGSKVATSGSALTFDGSTFLTSVGSNLTTRIKQLALDNYTNDGVGITFPRTSDGAEVMAFGVADVDKLGLFSRSGLIFATAGGGLYSAVTEKMRITETGQVNIGGNFTSTNNTLQVTGNAAIGYTAAAPTTGLIVAGNVGIGTDSPNDALEVVGSGAAGIRVSRSGASSQYVTISSGSTGPTINASTGINELSMGVNGARSMLINSSGNVGIGTTSPGAKLDVQGTSLRLNLQSTSNGQYATWKYVGKTSAGAAVDFEQGINITADNAFEIYDNTNTQNVSRYFNGASGYWQWFTNGTEKMRLDSSGNLGIGTSSPTQKLTVAGNVAAGAGGNNGFQFHSGSPTSGNLEWWLANNQGGNNELRLFYYSGGSFAGTAATFDKSGNLGLGVTPSAWSGVAPVFQSGYGSYFLGNTGGQTLHIGINHYYNGSTWIYTNSVAASRYDQTAGSHRWFRSTSTPTAGTDPVFSQAMTLDASGNLGIGETNPGSALVVKSSSGSVAVFNSTAANGCYIGVQNSGSAIGYLGAAAQLVNSGSANDMALRADTNLVFTAGGSTERARIDSAGTVFMRDGTSTTNTNSSRLVVGGTISETVSSTQYLVASQYDIGTAANEIPLNQYLGNLAYQDAGSIAGQVGLSAGTAALPSLVSATDTDTGMWFPAANTLAWSTNGTERARITSGGDLLVGATSVNAGYLVSPKMFCVGGAVPLILSNGDNTGTYLQFNTGAANGAVNIQADARTGAYPPLTFTTSATERARITSGGDFGIGTTSPAAKLDVQGLQNGISNPVNGTINVVDTAAAALGVGGQIVFRGSYTGTTSTMYAAITAYKESATVDGSQYGAALIFNTRTQGGNNTEKMRIDSSGNLGLGVTPSAWGFGGNLELPATNNIAFQGSYGNILSNAYYDLGQARFEYTVNGFAAQYQIGSAGQHKWFTAPSGNAGDPITFTQPMTLLANGNLGIGETNPAYKLDVAGTVRVGTGGSIQPILSRSGVSGGLIINTTAASAAGPLAVQDNGVDRLVIDASGNLGLGVTPTTVSNNKNLEIGGTNNAAIVLSTSSNNAAARNLAIASNFSAYGDLVFLQSNAVGGNPLTAGTQRMTLDASGRLLVGTTAAYSTAKGQFGNGDVDTGANAYAQIGFQYIGGGFSHFVTSRHDAAASSDGNAVLLYLNNSTSSGGSSAPGTGNVLSYFAGTQTHKWYTGNTERARITSGGSFLFGSDTNRANTPIYAESTTTSYAQSWWNYHGTTPLGLNVFYAGAAPNGAGNGFLVCNDTAAVRAEIRSNGGLANFQANNVNLSDQRTKKDIVAAPSYWDKIKGIEIVLFKYKDQTHDDNNVGVIAQQVEQVAPEFVDQDGWGETPEDGVPLKSIYTSDMYHAAIKALQEAMARIEKLEAEMAALKGA